MKTTNDFKIGDEVVYIPKHLLIGEKNEMVKTENLGIVNSINGTYVFVRYNGNETSAATRPSDLFFLNNRSDLVEQII